MLRLSNPCQKNPDAEKMIRSMRWLQEEKKTFRYEASLKRERDGWKEVPLAQKWVVG